MDYKTCLSRKEKLESTSTKVFECIGILLASIFIFPYIVFSFGFVFSKMWLWFVVPLGVSEISLLHAYGLCSMVRVLRTSRNIHKEDKKEVDLGKIGGVLLSPWFSLLIAYFVHLYM